MLRRAGPYFSGHLAELMHKSHLFWSIIIDYRLRLYFSLNTGFKLSSQWCLIATTHSFLSVLTAIFSGSGSSDLGIEA